MQKISFNDRYGLTDAVLSGYKTVTRRVEFTPTEQEQLRMMHAMGCHIDCNGTFVTAGLLGQPPVLVKRLRYQVGECVAISECYRRLADSHPDVDTFLLRLSMDLGVSMEDLPKHPGWSNKMFVRPSLLPRRLRITSAHVEQLQSITPRDCINEGLEWLRPYRTYGVSLPDGFLPLADDIRDAFSLLIDGVSTRGTWAANPFVVRYSFNLVTP